MHTHTHTHAHMHPHTRMRSCTHTCIHMHICNICIQTYIPHDSLPSQSPSWILSHYSKELMIVLCIQLQNSSVQDGIRFTNTIMTVLGHAIASSVMDPTGILKTFLGTNIIHFYIHAHLLHGGGRTPLPYKEQILTTAHSDNLNCLQKVLVVPRGIEKKVIM